MNYTSILRLATTFVAFSISAHSAEVFSVTTVSTTYPVTTATLFNATAEDGVTLTNPYNIYGTTDTGAGSGVAITTNFDGLNSAVNKGEQTTTGATSTTYFGPKFYAGINRDEWRTQGGVLHSNGNGYRIRSNTITASDIGTAQVGTAEVGTAAVAQVGVEGDTDYAPAVPASDDYVAASTDYQAATGNGGAPLNTRAIFMFDADTSSLSGAGDNLIFSDSDTLTAKLSVPGTMGPSSSPSRASLATYRAMVKANGQYYAGTLYNVDIAALPSSSTVFDMLETGAAATWTLMPNLETSSNVLGGETNLIVDTSETATTVLGKFLTNITQVGFLLETDSLEHTGGYNFGVREFIANATAANAPHPIEYSQDFTSPINGTGTFLTYDSFKLYDGPIDPANLLTGFDHALKWASNGAGLTATPDASTITQSNDQIVLDVKSQGPSGEVNIRMVGEGTDNARRVRPPSHEVIFEIDLIEWKAGQADLLLQTRGHDGYVRSVISGSGAVKYTTWGSALNDYQHTNFDDINSPSSLTDVVIVSGGTVDPAVGVSVEISGNAEGTVVLNANGDAVESVTLSGDLTGYTAEPTLTWTGMSAVPTVSFNYSNTVANTARQNVVQASMRDIDQDGTLDLPGTLLNDGQVLTYIQSYDNSDDSISYYYSLDGSAAQFITKLTAADHSPNGNGFFSISTGNKWGQPNNQDAVWIQYKKWGNATNEAGDLLTAKLGINSVSIVTSDDDRDGVINRNDALPNDPYESTDTDGDGVGDVGDLHNGYNDGLVAALDAAKLAADANTASTFDYYVADLGYSTGGGAITQEAYDAVLAEKATAVAAQATAEAAQATAVAALAAAPTASEIQSTFLNARVGSVGVSVSGGEATISLQVEESDDAMTTWSAPAEGATSVTIPVSGDATFFRVRAQ